MSLKCLCRLPTLHGHPLTRTPNLGQDLLACGLPAIGLGVEIELGQIDLDGGDQPSCCARGQINMQEERSAQTSITL